MYVYDQTKASKQKPTSHSSCYWHRFILIDIAVTYERHAQVKLKQGIERWRLLIRSDL